jgi:hypothetical protein
VWALGGAGLVGIGSFTVVGLLSVQQENADRGPDGCFPKCSDGAIQAIRNKQIIADTSLVVGVLALGAAALLFFTGSRD